MEEMVRNILLSLLLFSCCNANSANCTPRLCKQRPEPCKECMLNYRLCIVKTIKDSAPYSEEREVQELACQQGYANCYLHNSCTDKSVGG